VTMQWWLIAPPAGTSLRTAHFRKRTTALVICTSGFECSFVLSIYEAREHLDYVGLQFRGHNHTGSYLHGFTTPLRPERSDEARGVKIANFAD
jgi:hypothetical protein